MNRFTLLAGLRFESIQPSPLSVALWVGGTLLGLAFLIWTYRGIFQRSESRLAWLLFGMRAAGLAALWLILAKPTWTDAREKVEPGHVAVILDNSISMSLPDASGRSRYAAAREAYEKLKAALESRRGTRTAVDLFDIKGTPLPDGPPAEPKAEATELAPAVNQVLTRMRGKQLLGVVLLSDGTDTGGRTDFQELRDVRAKVCAAGFARDEAADRLDLAVHEPKATREVMVNNETAVEVPVSKSGGPATEATVTLKRGAETVASKTLSFAAGPGEQTAELKFTPTQAGSFVYTAAVESSVPEEILFNNAARLPLEVKGTPIRVLYVEGHLRWEFKYLKERLEEDRPDVELHAEVRRINPEQARLRPRPELFTTERLKNTDVVILGDMEGQFLSAAEYDALLKWLDQKSHSLVVLGGYASFGPDGWRNSPLAAALPVVFADAEPYQREGPFTLRLTDEGRRHPAFNLTGDHEKDAETWQDQGRLDGLCLVQRTKPGAVVLATHPGLKEGDEPAVVACYQTYGGGGKTLVLTVDTTWQWARGARLAGRSDTLYSRFWSQLVRWLAGRDIDDKRPLLTVNTDRAGYEPGKQVKVTVVRHPRPDVDFASAELAAELTGPDGKAAPVQLRSNSARPDEFTAAFVPPAGGRYELGVRLSGPGKLLGNQTAEFQVQGSALELADPRATPQNLEAIANATGGKYVDMSRAEALAEEMPQNERRRVEVERQEYWHSPALFVFFVAAVSLEWFLRRRNHMV